MGNVTVGARSRPAPDLPNAVVGASSRAGDYATVSIGEYAEALGAKRDRPLRKRQLCILRSNREEHGAGPAQETLVMLVRKRRNGAWQVRNTRTGGYEFVEAASADRLVPVADPEDLDNVLSRLVEISDGVHKGRIAKVQTNSYRIVGSDGKVQDVPVQHVTLESYPFLFTADTI